MRSVILSVVVSTLLVFPVTAAPKVFSTSVITAKGAAVSNDTYDKWAETSTELAQTKNQDFDIACDVTVVRSGDVVEHTTIPKLIDSVALMNQVRALQADVFVIEQLKYCGGPKPQREPSSPVVQSAARSSWSIARRPRARALSTKSGTRPA
jgi:hypothetical protein